jgi:hypothetical protein
VLRKSKNNNPCSRRFTTVFRPCYLTAKTNRTEGLAAKIIEAGGHAEADTDDVPTFPTPPARHPPYDEPHLAIRGLRSDAVENLVSIAV